MAREPGRHRDAHPRRPLPPTPTRFGALRHADFRFLLMGNLFTQMGQWSQQLGKGWLVYNDLGGSAFQLGVVAFAQGAGMFFMSPVGGALADRLNRRHLMLFSQVSLALVALALALIVMTDVVKIWHVYILAFLSGSFFALNNPARMSAIHDIVGRQDLPSAVSINAVVMNSMRVIGPAAGGALLIAIGTEGTFFLQSAGYVGGVISVLLMRRRFSAGRAGAPFFQSIADGVRYARGDRTIRALLTVSFLAALLGMSMTQLMAAFAKDVLGQEEGGFSALFITLGVGGLAGALMLVVKGDIRNKGLVYFSAAIGTGLFIAAMGAVGRPHLLVRCDGGPRGDLGLHARPRQHARPDERGGRVPGPGDVALLPLLQSLAARRDGRRRARRLDQPPHRLCRGRSLPGLTRGMAHLHPPRHVAAVTPGYSDVLDDDAVLRRNAGHGRGGRDQDDDAGAVGRQRDLPPQRVVQRDLDDPPVTTELDEAHAVALGHAVVGAEEALGTPPRAGLGVVKEADGVKAQVVDEHPLRVHGLIGDVLEPDQHLAAGVVAQVDLLLDPARVATAAALAAIGRAEALIERVVDRRAGAFQHLP